MSYKYTLSPFTIYSYLPVLIILILLHFSTSTSGAETSQEETSTFSLNDWKIEINTASGKADIFFNNAPLILQTRAVFKNGSTKYFAEDLKNHSVAVIDLNDAFGTGKKVQVTATTQDDKISLTHNYYFYQGSPYVLTDFFIESDDQLASNYMAPVFTTTSTSILPDGENKVIWVPFDNDHWVRYRSLSFGVSETSYEVGAFINNETRKGLVMGSIEHDNWKTGVRSSTTATNTLAELEIFGGVTSWQTRDVLPHGAVKGNIIKSPKILIGYFDDWRRGMEVYAAANEINAPKLPWDQGKPFLWNSWGAIQTNLSYTNATEVSQYFHQNLQNNNFSNDGTIYIGLDSYWDNITYSNLIQFVRGVNGRGQDAGTYWTPFVDWAKNPDRLVEGSTNVFYRDIYIYANGQPQTIAGAYAIDPTHPASIDRMNLYLNRFIAQGFTYLKLDFLVHGALEGDSFYNPEITTGIQAYNAGMDYIVKHLDGRMFINLSIAPLFPSQYGHSRRIACDAYASIGDTEYTMNSLTYGWWLDHVYSYNDADNVVLDGVSLGENRARTTSSVITGIFCAGDDFSTTGTATAKLKAEIFLTNPEVNNLARNAKAFYPVEVAEGGAAAEMFVQHVGDTMYLALFNYSATSKTTPIDLARIGLEAGPDLTILELWSGKKEPLLQPWSITVPRKDVKLYKIFRENTTSIPSIREEEFTVFPNPASDLLNFRGNMEMITEINIYNSLGQVVKSVDASQSSVFVGDFPKGVYLVSFITKDSRVVNYKLIKN